MYVDTLISPSNTSAIAQAIQIPGIAGMENNMVIFEYDKGNPTNLHEIIDNFALVDSGDFDICILGSSNREMPYKNGIHIWINSFDTENASLMILLGFIISGHHDWKKGQIQIFNIYEPGELEKTKKAMDSLVLSGRLPISGKNVVLIAQEQNISSKAIIAERSSSAGLTLIGIREELLKREKEKLFEGYDELGTILLFTLKTKNHRVMARFIKSRKDTHGASPGSLIFIGNKKMEKAEIRLLVYNQENVAEKKIESLNDIPAELSDNEIAWIDIYGLHEPEIVAGVGERFAIHTLEQEDIMNTDQRPKVVEKDDNFTFFLKILKFNEEIEKITSDQVTIVLRKNTVITFQEKPAHYFEPVRERIRKGVGKIRSSGADYLAYTLIDTLVDGYLHSIEKLGFRLESMEEEVLYDSNKKTVEKIYRLKNNIGFLRKSIFPLKEIMIILNKSESALFSEKPFSI